MSFGRPHKALLVSSLLAVAAIAAFIPVYKQLLADQRPPGAITDLKYGKHGFVLTRPDGRCSGWVRYELEYDGSYSFLFDGAVSYQFDGKDDDLVFRAGAAFNSLNQLSGTYLRFTHQDKEYQLRTDGVTPVTVYFNGMILGAEVKLQRSFEGPVEIYEPKSGEFLIRSQSFPSMEQLAERVKSATPFQPIIPFEMREQEEDSEPFLVERCTEFGKEPIVLDALKQVFDRLQSLALLRT